MPRRLILCAALAAASAAGLWAVPADVTYAEGEASLRAKGGAWREAAIGDTLNTGDALKTGRDGLVELDQKGVVIKVSGSTVFTIMEKEQAGKAGTVLSVALGSMKFRYDKLTGTEPSVRTNGASAGVRGTELTVYAGADGSTLFAVDSGAVTVEAGGRSVDLGAGEGVQVPLGGPPGEKITVHADLTDYAQWNAGRVVALLADPLAAMAGIESALAEYAANAADYAARFTESSRRLAEEREKRNQILADKGKDEAARYEDAVITPLSLSTGHLFLNERYYALAALSLRRFVAGRLYVMLKPRYITNREDPVWTEFSARFAALLDSFEREIAPHLVAADI
jgi:hypothetical protein